MKWEYSKINIKAYPGMHLPLYDIQGEIKAKVTLNKKEVGEIRGLLRETGYFYFLLEFKNYKHYNLDVLGRIDDENHEYQITLDGIPQSFKIKGYIKNQVNLEFLMMNLEDGVIELLIGGEIKP
ncbi:hypothetical protein HY837_04990 [archaeon]|nr:hypothetical protein [archaeon]